MAFGRGANLALLKRASGIAALGVAVAALVACGGSTSSGGSGSTSGGGNTVQMTNDNKFNPATLTVAKGTTVTWDNVSAVQHTVTLDPSKVSDKNNVSLPPGAQPSDSGFIDPKKKYELKFDVAGTYKYTCIPHEGQGMHGTITVQ
jgi:plastocyanin